MCIETQAETLTTLLQVNNLTEYFLSYLFSETEWGMFFFLSHKYFNHSLFLILKIA